MTVKSQLATTSGAVAGLMLGSSTALCLWCIALYALERDPYLGYTSDPEVTRVVTFIMLPIGAACLAAAVAIVVFLCRTAAVRWVAVSVGLPVVAAVAWLPASALMTSLT
ncbi:hypothetical protein [Pimelobacter simplex]|uniref:hypothetical protein n=1 Tax=Nocardioides simplex TaxID=2045 RepID=UPI001932BD0E|nr:hypothetical protein [Pimelobacter simplex]